MKIIMGAVSLDENHGCPYKHTNSQALKQLLEASNISTQSMIVYNYVEYVFYFQIYKLYYSVT